MVPIFRIIVDVSAPRKASIFVDLELYPEEWPSIKLSCASTQIAAYDAGEMDKIINRVKTAIDENIKAVIPSQTQN